MGEFFIMNNKNNLILAAALLAATSTLSAEGLGVAVNGGTLGVGAEIIKSINPNFNVRIGFNSFSKTKTMTESGNDYSAKLKLRTISLLADWQILAGGFRATAGVMNNGNKLTMSATGSNIGGTDIGTTATANVDVSFKKLSPYLGIG